MKNLCVILALFLGGCASSGTITTLEPVCDALVGPIHYSSKNPQSLRYAAPQLAPDLAVRNRVGINLGCPAYIHPASVPMPVKAPPTLMQRFQQIWRK